MEENDSINSTDGSRPEMQEIRDHSSSLVDSVISGESSSSSEKSGTSGESSLSSGDSGISGESSTCSGDAPASFPMQQEPQTHTESQELHLLGKRLKQRVKDFSVHHSTRNGLDIRMLKMKRDFRDVERKVQKLSLGTLKIDYPTKVILFLGAEGSGKTTLINAIVNSLFGIRFEDNFRLKVPVDEIKSESHIEVESKTNFITAYEFHYTPGMCFNYSVILIDTPGFGSTEGIERDRQITEMLGYYFKHNEVNELHGVSNVCFVISSSNTPMLPYVFEGLMAMLGKNFEQGIDVMATHADDESDDQGVAKVLMKANVSCSKKYLFNNNSLHQMNTSIDADESTLFRVAWNRRCDAITKFFTDIGKTAPYCFRPTVTVLIVKAYLCKAVKNLLFDICPCHASKLEKASDHITDVVANLQCLVIVSSKRNKNCEKSSADDDIICKFRSRSGKYCKNFHEGDMKTNKAKKETKAAIGHEEKIETSLRQIEQRMTKLKEIALKPDPLLSIQFIDSMIQTEKNAKQKKSIKYIESLQKQRVRAGIIDLVMKHSVQDTIKSNTKRMSFRKKSHRDLNPLVSELIESIV